jgi:hypothetical protein
MISQDLNGTLHYDRIDKVSCLLHYRPAAGSTQFHKPTDFCSEALTTSVDRDADGLITKES